MRAAIILIIAVLGGLFVLSFGGGLGYAQGGGTVRILTDEVIASSESGQAVAVGWSEVENFNASNTPLPKPAPGRTFWDAAPLLGLLVVAGVFIVMFIGHLKPADDDGEWQADPAVKPHHSGKEAKENARRYGPS